MIAEDQALLREGPGGLFADAGHDVVAAVGERTACAPRSETHEPELAVVDVRMPPSFTNEGLRLAQWIRETHPAVGRAGAVPARGGGWGGRAVSQGGFGYLLKDRVLDVADFLEAAERVAKRRLGTRSAGRCLARARGILGRARVLTEREREVLSLVAEGLTNSAIARRLVLTETHGRGSRPQCADEARSPDERRRTPARPRRRGLPPRRRLQAVALARVACWPRARSSVGIDVVRDRPP